MRGYYIRRLRQRLHMTQEDLAKASGLGQTTISKCETHVNKPNAATLLALAKALRCEPHLLRFGPEPLRVRRESTAPTVTVKADDDGHLVAVTDAD